MIYIFLRWTPTPLTMTCMSEKFKINSSSPDLLVISSFKAPTEVLSCKKMDLEREII